MSKRYRLDDEHDIIKCKIIGDVKKGTLKRLTLYIASGAGTSMFKRTHQPELPAGDLPLKFE